MKSCFEMHVFAVNSRFNVAILAVILCVFHVFFLASESLISAKSEFAVLLMQKVVLAAAKWFFGHFSWCISLILVEKRNINKILVKYQQLH